MLETVSLAVSSITRSFFFQSFLDEKNKSNISVPIFLLHYLEIINHNLCNLFQCHAFETWHIQTYYVISPHVYNTSVDGYIQSLWQCTSWWYVDWFFSKNLNLAYLTGPESQGH